MLDGFSLPEQEVSALYYSEVTDGGPAKICTRAPQSCLNCMPQGGTYRLIDLFIDGGADRSRIGKDIDAILSYIPITR